MTTEIKQRRNQSKICSKYTISLPFFRFLQNATVHFWNNTNAFTGMDYVGLYENLHKELNGSYCCLLTSPRYETESKLNGEVT
jgi:hypothetical protein